MAVRVVWQQKQIAALEEYQPRPPAEHEVLVRSHVSLISPGTERAFFQAMPNAGGAFPQYPGYSVVGTILATGAMVTDFRVGERVACVGHHESHVTVSTSECLSLPDEISDQDAAFFQVIAMVLQALRKVRMELGESVAIIGAGLMGCLAVKIAKVAGALPVVAFVRRPGRAALAERAGADAAVLCDEDPRSVFAELTGDDGAAVAIDATDHPVGVVLACSAAKRLGRVLLLGSVRGATESLNFYRDVHKKGLTIVGAHSSLAPIFESSPGFWTRADERCLALRMLQAQRIAVRDLVTDSLAWQEAPRVYNQLCQPETMALATVLRWAD